MDRGRRRPAPITGYVADTEHDEAQFVADEIDRLTDAGDAKPGDVAVFYRTNAQSRVFEEIFIRVGLPYKVVGGVRFYERKEVRDVLAYLRVLANPEDTVPLRRILNVPKRGIGDRAEAMIDALSLREKISFPQALRRVDEAYGMAARSANAVQALQRADGGAADRSSSPAPDRPSCSKRSWSRPATWPSCRRRPTRRTRPGSRTSRNWPPWRWSSSRSAPRTSGALSDFLEQVALVADSDQIPDEDDGRRGGVITLMTLHTAKGLEFPVVFLTGMEDGVFPHMRALGQTKELEEERRLAYVGHHPGAGAALPHPVLDAQRVGPARVQPAVALPGGDPGDADRVEAHGRRGLLAVRRLLGVVRPVGVRRLGRAVLRPGHRPVRHPPARRPGARGGLARRSATGSPTTRSASARSSRSRGSGDDAEATVDFGEEKPKRLLLRYAPVEKL